MRKFKNSIPAHGNQLFRLKHIENRHVHSGILFVKAMQL